jgi:hypothetical protein
MKKVFITVCVVGALAFLAILASGSYPAVVLAATRRATPTPTPTETPTPTPSPTPAPVPNLTQVTPVTLGPLEAALKNQQLGTLSLTNFVKYSIRRAVAAGVPANTIVLLLLLPVVALIIAAFRHIVGIRGFGIFLPAALSVVLVATGPIVGIGLFLLIVAVSTGVRLTLRKLKVKLQYLPRMALMLWFVSLGVLGVLFLTPIVPWLNIADVSIFPVLILALLAEDFTRVQLGKSARIAISLTSETLFLALISYLFLTLRSVQVFALLNPEVLLVSVFVVNFTLGRYTGLRFLEFWRFRRLIQA